MSQPYQEQLEFLDLVWRYKYLLAFYTLVFSFLTFTILYVVNGVPSELRLLDDASPQPQNPAFVVTASNTPPIMQPTLPAVNDDAREVPADFPVKILIEKINVNAKINNPTVSDNTTLNNALLTGAVRYPGSGTLAQGNMLIFGHSTGIRVVNNQAYKAFNHLDDLNLGDVIKVQSKTKEYRYKVVSVAVVDSTEELVDFSNKKDMLTLSTCNVFGEKQERFVVEAVFSSSVSL